MSQENVEILRQFFEAWNRRDFDEAVRNADKDFELHLIGALDERRRSCIAWKAAV